MCSAVGLVGSECVCVSQASDWSFLTRSSVAGCLCCFTFRLFWKCCERAFAHSDKFWLERLFSPELHMPRTGIAESQSYQFGL